MASSTPDTRFADYLDLFRFLNQTNATVVGGQAVNFWAEVFQDTEPEIQQFQPFTSADLDLHRPDASTTQLLRSQSKAALKEPDPFGKAFTIVSESFLVETKEGRSLPVQGSMIRW